MYMYLHEVSKGSYYLDHRLTPEVRAMLCAMASRMPKGGIKARYNELVDGITKKNWEHAQKRQSMHPQVEQSILTWEDIRAWGASSHPPKAEERLTFYPLPEKAKEFFDKFVAQYGHSSVLELTGSPAVFFEDISWWTAYQLFDNPLVSGQEFSTRAMRRRDWPMCREAGHDPELKELHEAWLQVFEDNVSYWKTELRSPCPECEDGCKLCDQTGKKYPWITDPQAFRPAFDRARWALPGTIATGCSQTANLRVSARVVRAGQLMAQRSGHKPSEEVWRQIHDTYYESLPGMQGMGLKEAVYDPNTKIPLKSLPRIVETSQRELDDFDVYGYAHVSHIRTDQIQDLIASNLIGPIDGRHQYLDPIWNDLVQVDLAFICSLAVARDWHRHRTFYPMSLEIMFDPNTQHLCLSPFYKYQDHEQALTKSSRLFSQCMNQNNIDAAMLCLPLGTSVLTNATAGLRDVVYALTLRANAHGANFEYQTQARQALTSLTKQLEYALPGITDYIGEIDADPS